MAPAPSADLTAGLLADARALHPEITDLRHRLHREPEVGLDLPRTQQKVLDWLDGLGFEVFTGTRTTSVTAVLRGGGQQPSNDTEGAGQRPAVLLRGDMDALPIHEETGLDYASQIDGAMHACGHDLHTSMLAGAASLLAARRDELPGDVVLMFQPGEEGCDGASVMIEEGVLEAAGRRVDAAYGLHVTSALAPGGVLLTREGPIMSAADGLVVSVRGAGGHGSAPHLARDPITAAAEMITALQAMVTRQFDIFDPVVLTVGVVRASTARNVIPDQAFFEATIRSYSAEANDRLRTAIPRLLQGIAEAHGVAVEVDYLPEYPVTVNDPAETAATTQVIRDLFGPERHVEMPHPLGGSEDFSRVLELVPGSFAFLSAVPEGVDPATAPYNHSAQAVFADDVLPDGAALYAALAIRRLARGKG